MCFTQTAALAYPDPLIVRATITVSLTPRTHTIVTGGTPGWQTTRIPLGTAALAADAAVALNRSLTGRRRTAGLGR